MSGEWSCLVVNEPLWRAAQALEELGVQNAGPPRLGSLTVARATAVWPGVRVKTWYDGGWRATVVVDRRRAVGRRLMQARNRKGWYCGALLSEEVRRHGQVGEREVFELRLSGEEVRDGE